MSERPTPEETWIDRYFGGEVVARRDDEGWWGDCHCGYVGGPFDDRVDALDDLAEHMGLDI